MNNYCFVAQPFDRGKFDQRYQDVIKPAIESLGLYAYRVDEDFTVEIPINTIESKILSASIVVAEITTDNPNVWFELGYALALAKPIILLCSDERKTTFPFDVRHRNIITYHTGSLGDFEEYRTSAVSDQELKYRRIEFGKFDSGISGSKLPQDF